MAVDDGLDLAVALWRDDGGDAPGLEVSQDGVGVIALVAHEHLRLGPRLGCCQSNGKLSPLGGLVGRGGARVWCGLSHSSVIGSLPRSFGMRCGCISASPSVSAMSRNCSPNAESKSATRPFAVGPSSSVLRLPVT